MNKANRLIGIVITTAALMATACANNITAKRISSIPGITNSNVRLFINNDDGSVILVGNVRRNIDRRAIEEYVREEYGYEDIDNQLITQ